MSAAPGTRPVHARAADWAAFGFVLVVLIYAASGPLSEFVRWFIEVSTPGFDELSRRDQRLLFKSHPVGALYRGFEQSVLLPTGMILGLPLAFGFVIVSLSQHRTAWINWLMALVSVIVFGFWIANLFAIDGGLLPSARSIDYVLFPIITAITLYLTWRNSGTFIVGFCLFWVNRSKWYRATC